MRHSFSNLNLNGQIINVCTLPPFRYDPTNSPQYSLFPPNRLASLYPPRREAEKTASGRRQN
jgi:hypothetical protein